MNQRSSVTIKVSNSNESGVDLRFSSNMISNSNYETNFLCELLVTNRQVANLRKTFANNLLTNIKLSKIQISKIIQSGGFFWYTSWTINQNWYTTDEKCVSTIN